ncbi:MAG: histidinol-phosphate transaminase [Planctomycetota bacterium]|jgi:histidinol-phosphate aminotransferase
MTYFRPNIEQMEGYIPGEQPEDPSIIKLNTNENPYPTSPRVLEAIAQITPDQLRRYPHPLGNQFRDTAAKIFGVTKQHIICGNGMDDILNMSVRAFSGPEAALVYPTPTYILYSTLANIQASVVREVPFNEDYSLPLEKLIHAGGKVTYLVNPNSPSGTFVPLEQVADLADKLTGVLCLDEAYVDFASQDCMELAKTRPNVLVMRTMSKGYSLAGLRFGFAVGHPNLIKGLMKVKDSYNVDALSIAAASAALADQDHYLKNRQKIIAERKRMVDALHKLGLPCYPSQANFLLARATKPSAEDLYESLKKRKILVRYFNSPGIEDKLRISVGKPEENDALINALSELNSG